jgi:hypothetical protein
VSGDPQTQKRSRRFKAASKVKGETMRQIEIGGAADASRAVAEMTEAELRLAAAAEAAIEKILDASPQKRAARIVEWAAGYKCASDEARVTVANHLVGFARGAADFLERGDFGGLDSLISAFASSVRRYAEIPAEMPPPQMPPIGGDVFYKFGWSAKEQESLQFVLLTPSLGVKRGDRVIEIDEDGVRLASGLHFTRDQIFAGGPHRAEGTRDNDRPSRPPERTGMREVR